MKLSEEHQAIIKNISILDEKIVALHVEMDLILDPVAVELMGESNLEYIKTFARLLPSGFARSELMAYYNQQLESTK
jgi:hypothetical protein